MPFATVAEIEAALAQTAAPLAGVRFGRVDAFAALRRLGKPSPRLLPTIRGYAYVGETLTAYSGVWAGAPLELTYRWVRCRTTACGKVTTVAETRTYRIRVGDRRHRLRVVITASDGAGSITAASRPTLRVR